MFQELVLPKIIKNCSKKWRGPFQITEEDRCIPAKVYENDYWIVVPACEVNESATRDKNGENELMDECDLPLDLDLTERIEVDDETIPYVEEVWN